MNTDKDKCKQEASRRKRQQDCLGLNTGMLGAWGCLGGRPEWITGWSATSECVPVWVGVDGCVRVLYA